MYGYPSENNDLVVTGTGSVGTYCTTKLKYKCGKLRSYYSQGILLSSFKHEKGLKDS